MITKRIIPCLDVRNGRVVKGTNFQGLQDVSSPVELGKFYSDNGADELVFYDITASAEGRQLFTDVLGARLFGIRALLVEPMAPDHKWYIRLKRVLEKPFVTLYYKRGGQRSGE